MAVGRSEGSVEEEIELSRFEYTEPDLGATASHARMKLLTVLCGVIIGMLVASVALATVLSLYVGTQTTAAPMTTVTTTTTSTSTSTSSSTTSTTSSTTSTTSSTSTSTTTSTSTSTSTTTSTSALVLSYIYWSFDSNFNDMYNIYNGVGMNNASFISPGYTGSGSALSLNRTEAQYVLVPSYKDMTYTSFTWELWAYSTDLDTYESLMMGMCQTPSANLCMYLMIRLNRTYLAFHSNDCWGPTTVYANRWYHFAFVYDFAALTQYIYLNGVLECTNGGAMPFQASTGAITIGAINNTGTVPAAFWSGYIDHMSYVSRAKTPIEILDDATLVAYYSFNASSLYDLGPNKINGTGVGLSSTTGRVGQAILVNTAGAYFQAGRFTLLGVSGQAYSISLWVNKVVGSTPGGTLVHVSGNANGTYWCIAMMGLSASDQIVGQGWNGTMYAMQGPVLSAGVWTHIVTSYSITNGVSLWVNGALIGSTGTFPYAASGIPNYITVGLTLPAAVGCAAGSITIGQFYGAIDELRVYSRELTASDVATLANP